MSIKYNILMARITEIECGTERIETTILIVKEKLQTLLGRKDTKALRLLHVGTEAFSDCICSVKETAPFGKLKDFQLHIPIKRKMFLQLFSPSIKFCLVFGLV